MASIHKEFQVDGEADAVWDAIADFGALPTRLVPGFVTDTQLDGEGRIVTYANGNVALERLVGCDRQRKQLAYAVVCERLAKHSASVPAIEEGSASCRLVWTTDVLPNDIAPFIGSK